MDHHQKLQHQSLQEQVHDQQTTHGQSARTFEEVEDLLRHDSTQITVPARVAERLQESIAADSRNRSWWSRLFGHK